MLETTHHTGIEKWFDSLIATLRTHQIQLETETAQPDLKKFYETIFAGNADELAYMGKTGALKHFVPRIIIDYLKLTADHQPLKLAFDHNDSEVLVWAEIGENNEALERTLLKAEAAINAKYHQYGFDMETTIVEAGDRLQVPNHYIVYKA